MRDENVRGFQVTMDCAVIVQIAKAPEDVNEVSSSDGGLAMSELLHDMVQGPPRHPLLELSLIHI